MKEQFGYCANTAHAKEMLEGNYSALEPINQATAEIFKEVAWIRKVIGTMGINEVITGEEWGKCASDGVCGGRGKSGQGADVIVG